MELTNEMAAGVVNLTLQDGLAHSWEEVAGFLRLFPMRRPSPPVSPLSIVSRYTARGEKVYEPTRQLLWEKLRLFPTLPAPPRPKGGMAEVEWGIMEMFVKEGRDHSLEEVADFLQIDVSAVRPAAAPSPFLPNSELRFSPNPVYGPPLFMLWKRMTGI